MKHEKDLTFLGTIDVPPKTCVPRIIQVEIYFSSNGELTDPKTAITFMCHLVVKDSGSIETFKCQFYDGFKGLDKQLRYQITNRQEAQDMVRGFITRWLDARCQPDGIW